MTATMAVGDEEFLEFNPFADHRPPPPDPPHFLPSKPIYRPKYKRRNSGSDTTDSSVFSNFSRHSRSLSEAPAGSGSGQHPLRSAGLASSSSIDLIAGVTRPRLARIVNGSTLADEPSVDLDVFDQEPGNAAEEKLVLVHEVRFIYLVSL